MRKVIRPLTQEQLQDLIAVARKEKAADVMIENTHVINVYSQEMMRAHVAISGKHVAYVGEQVPRWDDHTLIIDGRDYLLCAGYIEPHMHPTQVYNPATMAEKALRCGTTTIVNDGLVFFTNMPESEFLESLDAFSQYPVKMFWSARLDPQSQRGDLITLFTPQRLRRILEHPFVLQVGELSGWPELLSGDPDMVMSILDSQALGKRAEGHLPGASFETLNAASAAGIRACHESISVEEVLGRLRVGMYATLRHSSIRPDLPELVKGLLEAGIPWSNRLMFTTDGSTPPMWAEGFTDYLLHLAMEAGLDPLTAYRLVTLNPATYYGLDGELGGIAPGRLADILFLQDERHPRPLKVMAEGKMLVEEDVLKQAFPLPEVIRTVGTARKGVYEWRARDELFRLPVDVFIQEDDKPVQKYDGLGQRGRVHIQKEGEEEKTEVAFPVIHFRNAVITVAKEETFPIRDGAVDWQSGKRKGLTFVSLMDKHGKWVTNGLLEGFAPKLEGLASTFSFQGDVITLGNHIPSMTLAMQRVLDKKGALVLVEGGEVVQEIDLPLFASMSLAPFDEVMVQCQQLFARLQQAGYPFLDPLYSLIFLPSTHLPRVRITPEGVYSVKEDKILYPSLLMS